MPPRKRQRTGTDSSAATQEREEEQPNESEAPTDQGEEEIQTEPALIEDKSSDDDSSLPEMRDECSQRSYVDSTNCLQTSVIPQYEYIGIHRPHFDYEVENRVTREHGDIHEWYSKGFDADNRAGVILEPAKDHPEHKWCMIWEGYKMFMDYRRRAKYCSPDNFDMYIYNDWEGRGYQELLQNFVGVAD